MDTVPVRITGLTWRWKMARKLIASALLLLTFSAFASCPQNMPYRCYSTASGKQVCGCGY